ncbi:Inner membrane ABC transporter permease protein ycjP [uncultured Roseburia sp.]|uniref:Carbohydrate ABC transporter permease n=1 Tax=Brotonthovivens ammoniilytica TaxID=2981725 RepID=A0ABT2TNF9_9FIRM|nr:carbohydrate ABC transporter permease [Brotonthovivens ammoniilytica]MCU6763788.1 carbohydrate ABC transporter permease [Brotonthovivens ammoniilytica]SCJ35401.1 Inner membrane ABC transporter permease protein ycjP [uncultured Roseburia sp.]
MVGSYKKPVKIILSILLVLGGVFAGFPVLWMVCSSLKSNSAIFAWPPKFFDETASLSSYLAVLTDPSKIRFFVNSYIIAACVVAATLFVGILAAYAFSRFDFPGKAIFNSLVVSVQAIPPIVLLIPYMGMIVSMRLFNTYFALILTYLITTLPYCILMMTGYLNTLSRELDEAVMIDGGSRWKALWSILVPISLPGMVSVGMYTFMQAWNEYLFALTLTQTTNMRTVPIGINLLMGQHAYDWSQMMAMSVLGSLPVLVLFIFFQKYFIAGMSSGGVKG